MKKKVSAGLVVVASTAALLLQGFLPALAVGSITATAGPACGAAGTCNAQMEVFSNQSSISNQAVQNRVASNFIITIPAGEDVYLNSLSFTATLDSSYSALTGGDVVLQNQAGTTNDGTHFDYGTYGQVSGSTNNIVTVTPNLIGQTGTGTGNMPANTARLRGGNSYLITATVYANLPAGLPQSITNPIANPHVSLTGCLATGVNSGITFSCNSVDGPTLQFVYPFRFIISSIGPGGSSPANTPLSSPATIKWVSDLPSTETLTLELHDGSEEINGDGPYVATIASNIPNTGSYTWNFNPTDYKTNTYYIIDLVPSDTRYPMTNSIHSTLLTSELGNPPWLYIKNPNGGPSANGGLANPGSGTGTQTGGSNPPATGGQPAGTGTNTGSTFSSSCPTASISSSTDVITCVELSSQSSGLGLVGNGPDEQFIVHGNYAPYANDPAWYSASLHKPNPDCPTWGAPCLYVEFTSNAGIKYDYAMQYPTQRGTDIISAFPAEYLAVDVAKSVLGQTNIVNAPSYGSPTSHLPPGAYTVTIKSIQTNQTLTTGIPFTWTQVNINTVMQAYQAAHESGSLQISNILPGDGPSDPNSGYLFLLPAQIDPLLSVNAYTIHIGSLTFTPTGFPDNSYVRSSDGVLLKTSSISLPDGAYAAGVSFANASAAASTVNVTVKNGGLAGITTAGTSSSSGSSIICPNNADCATLPSQPEEPPIIVTPTATSTAAASYQAAAQNFVNLAVNLLTAAQALAPGVNDSLKQLEISLATQAIQLAQQALAQ